MKKALSIFLGIALIAVSVFTPVSINAGATTVNMIYNGNFETDTSCAANAYGLGEPVGRTIRGIPASSPLVAITTSEADFGKWYRATWGNATWHNTIVTEGSNRVCKFGQNMYQGNIAIQSGKTYQISFKLRAGTMLAGTQANKVLSVQLVDATTAGVGGGIEAKFLMATGSISGTILNPSGQPAAGSISANTETYAKWINMPIYESTDYYTYTMKFTVGAGFVASDKYALKFIDNSAFSTPPAGTSWYNYIDDIALYELSTTTFDSQSGSAVAPVTAPVGTDLTLTTPTRTGYTFDGWYTAAAPAGTLVTSPYTTVAGGTTLYAHWSQVTTATINFDSNGGSSVPSVTKNIGDTIATSPTTTLLGSRFEGWYTALSGGSQASFPYTVSGNATLYANWTNVGTGTVTYDSQSGSAVDPVTVTKGTTVAAPTSPTYADYSFLGWYDAATGGNKITFPYTVNDDTTLYAQWVESYTVSATAAVGGTASASKALVLATDTDKSVTFTATVSYPYSFMGWYKDGVLYNQNLQFTEDVNANTTYQARFAAPAGQQIVNGDFETPTGYDSQDNIYSRFPSPLYGTPGGASAWDSASEYQRWFRASVGNATIYSNIITDPDNASNHIGRVMQTALQGVTVSSDAKAYRIQFKAKSEYAYQKFTIGFADMTNATTSSVHPTLFPITSIVSGTKTYLSGGSPVTETINPYDAPSTSIVMPLATDQWVTYDFIVTLGASTNPGALCALRFGCSDYDSTHAYFLDDVSLQESSFPEKLASLDADSNAGKVIASGSNATITETAPDASAPTELGSSVYSITTNADYQAAWADSSMYLKAGKQYDLSFWFKVADDHPILTTSTENYKYITFFLKTAIGGTTNIPVQSTALVSSLTRDPAGGQKVVTKPAETTAFLLNSAMVKDTNGNAIWQKVTVSFTPSADTSAAFGIRPNAAGTVYIDQIKLTSAENATASVQSALTAVGAAIRTNGKQALRFKTSIDKSAILNPYFGTYEIVEYGTVAIKTSYLNGEELKDASYTQADGQTVKAAVKGAAYIKGSVFKIYSETETSLQYTAALTGISQANYNTSYSVRAYAVLARPDGTTFTVYDDATREASIYEIATLAYNAVGSNDGYAETPAVRTYLFDNILSKADFTTYPGDGFKPVA